MGGVGHTPSHSPVKSQVAIGLLKNTGTDPTRDAIGDCKGSSKEVRHGRIQKVLSEGSPTLAKFFFLVFKVDERIQILR